MLADKSIMPRRSGHVFGQIAPGAAVAVVVLESATGFLPGDPLISVLTPLRLVVLCGLAALLIEGARLGTFRTRMDIPIAVLLLSAVVATLFGGGTSAPLRGFLTQLAAYYLVVGLRRRQPESWRALAMLAVASVSIAGTVAFTQVTNGTPTGFCRSGLLGDADCGPGMLVRSIGTFANPNTLAAFLLLLAPIATLAAAVVAERTTQVIVVTLAIIGYGAVLTTFSRAGYIAAVAGVLILAAARGMAPRLSRRQVHLAGAVAVTGLAGFSLVIAISSRAGDALGVRGRAWAAAIDVARSQPLGVGLQRAGAVIDARAPGGVTFSHVHNLWLNWLTETGMLGLLGITAVTAVGVISAARLARDESPTGAAGLAGLTAFLLMSVLDHPANLERVAMMFWLVLGLVMAETPPRWRHSSRPPAVPSRKQAAGERPARSGPPRSAGRPPTGRLAPGRPKHPAPHREAVSSQNRAPEPAAETCPVPAVRADSPDPRMSRPLPAQRSGRATDRARERKPGDINPPSRNRKR